MLICTCTSRQQALSNSTPFARIQVEIHGVAAAVFTSKNIKDQRFSKSIFRDRFGCTEEIFADSESEIDGETCRVSVALIL